LTLAKDKSKLYDCAMERKNISNSQVHIMRPVGPESYHVSLIINVWGLGSKVFLEIFYVQLYCSL